MQEQNYSKFYSKIIFEELENYERENYKAVKKICDNSSEELKKFRNNINILNLHIKRLKLTIDNQEEVIKIQRQTIKFLEESFKNN